MKPKFIYNRGLSTDCPVPPMSRLGVIFRDNRGTVCDLDLAAVSYMWEHMGKSYDIIAYQIIEDKS